MSAPRLRSRGSGVLPVQTVVGKDAQKRSQALPLGGEAVLSGDGCIGAGLNLKAQRKLASSSGVRRSVACYRTQRRTIVCELLHVGPNLRMADYQEVGHSGLPPRNLHPKGDNHD
jgi:hypothetical protein